MSILERLASAKAAGLTFAANFWPWLLGAFLIGAGVAGYSGFKLAKLLYQDEAREAQLHLANFRADLATSTAEGQRLARERHEQALDAIIGRNNRIEADMAAIPAKVAALMAPKINQLRESLNAPQFDCLRLPFPPPALRMLERPGNGVGPAGVGGDPGGSPTP